MVDVHKEGLSKVEGRGRWAHGLEERPEVRWRRSRWDSEGARCMLKGRKVREEDHGVGESVSNRRFNG